MVGAFEHDDRLAARVGPGDLHAGLDGLGTGVELDRLLGEVARRQLAQPLEQAHLRLVAGDDATHVDQVLGLPLDGVDHGSRRVSQGQCAYTAGHVDEAVAINVLHDGAVGPGDGHVGEARCPARSGGVPPGRQLQAARTRHGCPEGDAWQADYLLSAVTNPRRANGFSRARTVYMTTSLPS